MSMSLQVNTEGLSRSVKLWAFGGAGAAVMAAVAWAFTCGDCNSGATPGGRWAMPSLMGAASEAPDSHRKPQENPGDASTALRSIGEIESALFEKGSLRGTEGPGWGVGRDEALKPNRVLRDRFDYYLLSLSEASLPELTALISAHALRDLGAKTAGEVMQVWDRYLSLQQYGYKVQPRLDDPMSLQAALQEHRQVRQSLLGMHWAEAFYGDEEKKIEADIERTIARAPPARDVEAELMASPKPGTDIEALHRQRIKEFGAEAARRLADLDRETAEWEKRIDVANAKVQSLKSAAELSDEQRAAAVKQLLDSTFSDPTERLRAGGLVGE